MKPEQLYQHLKDLAEKLDITVSEQNLRLTGVNAKSGLCTVKGRTMFIMDKHLAVREKIARLGSCLSRLPHEEIYVVPAVRELLRRGV